MPFEPLGEAAVVERGAGRVRLRAGTATVEVTALAPDLYRVGLFPEGKPPDYGSEAIAHELAPGGELPEVDLHPLRIAGDALELESGVALAGVDDLLGPRLRVVRPRAQGERYFGCGERTSGLEKTGSHQVFWNVDPPQGHTASFNNL
jgi:alpha-glucosidase